MMQVMVNAMPTADLRNEAQPFVLRDPFIMCCRMVEDFEIVIEQGKQRAFQQHRFAVQELGQDCAQDHTNRDKKQVKGIRQRRTNRVQ